MEIKLVCDDDSILAAMFSTWRSVRNLPLKLKLPVACMLMENEHFEQMGPFDVYQVDEIMTQLFPLLGTYLDPELADQYDELERQAMENRDGYLYEPAVRKYLEVMGQKDLANTKS